jgi:hypothetical protein
MSVSLPDLAGRRVAVLAPAETTAVLAARRAGLVPTSPLVTIAASTAPLLGRRADVVLTVGTLSPLLAEWLRREQAARPDMPVYAL